jgi:NADH:ubiquinone oxidoreductase subunit 3 (subunit A)
MLDDYFRQYGIIAIFIAVAVAVPVGMLLASSAFGFLNIRPSAPSFVKNSLYECGFEALTDRWSNFNFRHYSLAIDFVIFDVEVVFLFPWAAAFALLSVQFGLSFFLPMMAFMAVLVLGWAYAWRKGSLEWS